MVTLELNRRWQPTRLKDALDWTLESGNSWVRLKAVQHSSSGILPIHDSTWKAKPDITVSHQFITVICFHL